MYHGYDSAGMFVDPVFFVGLIFTIYIKLPPVASMISYDGDDKRLIFICANTTVL